MHRLETEYVRVVCVSQYVHFIFQMSSAFSGEEKMPWLVSQLHHNPCCRWAPLLCMGTTKNATQYPLSVWEPVVCQWAPPCWSRIARLCSYNLKENVKFYHIFLHTWLTTMLRPSCYLKMLESWIDRRLIARLVAEVVGDRGWSWTIVGDRANKISRSKLFQISELGFQVAKRYYMVVPPVFHDRVSGLRWSRLMIRLVVDRHH